MRYKIVAVLLFAVLPWLLLGSGALALTPPDSMTIYSTRVVRNTVEDGDVAIAFHYFVDDNSYTDPASSTILFRLYDTDNTTLLSSTVPYVYFGYGYDNGIALFYFSASDNLTWGEAYRINIAGSPAFFDPQPTPYNYFLSSSDYSSETTQAANQDLMTDYVLGVARLLEIAYPTYSLYGSTDMGVVLSAVGEAYFRGAMPGLQSIAPDLFLTQHYIPTLSDMGLGSTQATTYEGRLEDSDIMDGFEALGNELGVAGQSVAGGVAFICAIGLVIYTNRLRWGSTPGIIAAMILLSGAAVTLGGALMLVRLTLGLIAAIMLFYLLFFKRS
jgi:hypothetical protein